MLNYLSEGKTLTVVASHPAAPTSGCVVRCGNLLGVAVLAEGEGGVGATETVTKFGGGVYNLNTLAENSSGASAIAAFDALYYVDADAHLSKKTTSGYFFGYALEANASGHAVIEVLHVAAPGDGTTPADTSVTTAKLVDNNVTAGKLTATLGKGLMPLDMFSARVIGTNEIAAVVGAATDPILSRSNVATDKSGRLSWASGSVLEIQLPTVISPPDLDDGVAITVHVLANMKSGSVDTPVIAVGVWEGIGGSNVGGNTAALSTTLAELIVTVAAGSVSAAPQPLAITLKPGAHATGSNDVYVFGVWLEYTRK
jgi:predicted RecA/RadA family phage recombinase